MLQLGRYKPYQKRAVVAVICPNVEHILAELHKPLRQLSAMLFTMQLPGVVIIFNGPYLG